MKTAASDFVSTHAEGFSIKRMCQVLELPLGLLPVDRRRRGAGGRQFEEDALVEEIREIHAGHRGNHGALRVHAELRGLGHTVNHKRVTRLARKHYIGGSHLRKKKCTTIPDRLTPPVADLVQRDFTASTLDEKWCGNITHAQVGAAWIRLAYVIDIRSRRVLGWSMAPHMRAELVFDALRAAVATRGGDVTGVIFHANRGSQYTSAAFAQVCDLHGIRRSMGRVGSSHDNALAESFWQELKRETMYRRVFVTMSQTRLEIFRWLTYCNARRRHRALSYLSPIEFEKHHHRTAELPLTA